VALYAASEIIWYDRTEECEEIVAVAIGGYPVDFHIEYDRATRLCTVVIDGFR
jgi:hypothetical protein